MKRTRILIASLGLCLSACDRAPEYPGVDIDSDHVQNAIGNASYSALGAQQRIMKFAEQSEKDSYVAEANKKLRFVEEQINQWRRGRPLSVTREAELESLRQRAYDQTDRNLKAGQDPLAYVEAKP